MTRVIYEVAGKQYKSYEEVRRISSEMKIPYITKYIESAGRKECKINEGNE